MKLVGYEFKKYILKPSVIAFVFLFLILNICKIFEIYFYLGDGRSVVSGETNISEARRELYEKYGGKITDEKINALKKETESAQKKLEETGITNEPMEGFYTGYPFGDVQLLKYELIPAYEYAILYSNHSDYITSIAIENISYFAEASPYESARNKLIASSYINRRVDYCVKSDGFIKLFDYKFSTLLSMLLIILTLSPIFSGEYVNGSDKLIKATGKRILSIKTKLITAFVFIAFLSVIFFAEDMLTIGLFYGMDCFEAPVFALKEYLNCPFCITISSAVLISFLGRFVFILCFTSVICALSSVFKSTVSSFISSIGFGALLVILSEVLPKPIDITSLIYMSDFYTEFSVCNIFGVPVFSLVVVMIISLLLSGISLLITVRRAFR